MTKIQKIILNYNIQIQEKYENRCKVVWKTWNRYKNLKKN